MGAQRAVSLAVSVCDPPGCDEPGTHHRSSHDQYFSDQTCTNDDGATHAVLSPMGFMGRLAALVPSPRVNLTRFHGVFSPNSKLREHVVPHKPVEQEEIQKTKAYSMAWA